MASLNKKSRIGLSELLQWLITGIKRQLAEMDHDHHHFYHKRREKFDSIHIYPLGQQMQEMQTSLGIWICTRGKHIIYVIRTSYS